jgi:hypothetical protein
MTSCQENTSILTDGTFIEFYFFKSQERETQYNWSRIYAFHAKKYMIVIISQQNNKM